MDTLFCMRSVYDLLCPLPLLVPDVLGDTFLLAVRPGALDELDTGGSFSVIAVSLLGISAGVC